MGTRTGSLSGALGFAAVAIWTATLGGVAWGATASLGGAAQPAPSDTTPVLGQEYDVAVVLSNTSFSEEPGNQGIGIRVNVITMQLVLACTTSLCANELAGTVTFVPQGATGCLTSDPCVTSCRANPTNANRVDFTLNNCSLQPNQLGRTLATVRVRQTAVTPLFFMRSTAAFAGTAGQCVIGFCNNAAAGHTCANSDPNCNWSGLVAAGSGSAMLQTGLRCEDGPAPTCGGTCPSGQTCAPTGTGTCECVVACEDATAPMCMGMCPMGQMCAPTGTGGCECITLCEDAAAPTCMGMCPMGQTCAPTGTGGCECMRPCRTSPFPVCDGMCPMGQECLPTNVGICFCFDVTPCNLASAPMCNGDCPSGQTCSPTGTGGCSCVVTQCEDSEPTCGGPCPPGRVCSSISGNCQCVVPACEDSEPTCGGPCPPGRVCSSISGNCQCVVQTCEDTEPTCGGTCPPGRVCSSISGNCQCVVPPCATSGFPTCDGACPTGQICSSTTSGACVCRVPDCEDATAPQCNGTCPPGQTCAPDGTGFCACSAAACGEIDSGPCEITVMRPDGTFLTRLFSSLQAAVTAAPNGTSRAPTIIDVRGVCVGITLLEERSNLLIQGEMPAACPPGTSLRSTLKGDPSADPPDGSKGEVVKVIDSQNIVVRYLNIVDGGEHDGLEFKETLRSTGDCNCVARNDEGYELDGGSSHVIRDSLVTDNVNGIRLHAGAVDNLVIGNISEFNAEHGIVLLDSDVEQNTVLDNTVRANGADCIHLDEADFNDVVENTVGGGISSPQLDCGGTDIRLVNDADFNFINGNVDPNGRLVPVQCTGSTLDGNTGNNCLAR